MRKGLTLLETLISISIIVILTSIGFVTYAHYAEQQLQHAQ